MKTLVQSALCFWRRHNSKHTAAALCAAAMTLAHTAQAFTLNGTTGNLQWSLSYNAAASTGTLTISGNGEMPDYTAPRDVTTAPWGTYRDYITSVSIEAGVTKVGNRAFNGMNKITTVTFATPAQLRVIGQYVWRGCTALRELVLPEGVTNIGYEILDGCSAITRLSIPSTVTRIGDGSGGNIFYGNGSLKYLDIAASNPTTLGITGSFGQYLTAANVYVRIPSGAQANYAGVATGATGIAQWDNFAKKDGGVFLQLGEEAPLPANTSWNCGTTAANVTCAVDFSTGVLTVTKAGGAGVQTIAVQNAYANRNYVTSIVIGDDLDLANNHTFGTFSNLTTVTLGKDVANIYDNNFRQTSSFTQFIVNAANTTFKAIDGVLFSVDETKLWHFPRGKAGAYTIPNTVTSFGGSAFAFCTQLTELTIPANAATTDWYLMEGCTGLTRMNINTTDMFSENVLDGLDISKVIVYVPSGLVGTYSANDLWKEAKCIKAIGDVSSCPVYWEIGYPVASAVTASLDAASGTLTISGSGRMMDNPNWGAYKLQIQHVVFQTGNTITKIGNGAFKELYELVDVTGLTSLDTIGNSAFEKCYSLTTFSVPASVNYIGTHAFANCPQLTALTIPAAITQIQNNTFDGCTRLTGLNIQGWNSVTSVGDAAFRNVPYAFTLPASLAAIGNSAFSGTAMTSADLSNVTSLGTSVFRDCRQLSSVTFRSDMTVIPDYSFYGCTALTSVTLPNTLQEIKLHAFNGTKLTSIAFGSNLTTIGNYAFAFTDIRSAVIPDNVTSLGNNAFRHCDSLRSVSVGRGVSTWENAAFSFCGKLTAIEVSEDNPNFVSIEGVVFEKATPIVKLVMYPGGKPSFNINAAAPSVTTFQDAAFQGASGLRRIRIPAGITSLASYAFGDCSSLIGIYLYRPSTSGITAIAGNLTFENVDLSRIMVYALAADVEAYRTGVNWSTYGFAGFDTIRDVTGVTLDQSDLTLIVGSTGTLTATVTPNGAVPDVLWTSDYPLIAQVVDGVVTGMQEGEAIITATTEEGGFTASCNVHVNVPREVRSVRVTPASVSVQRGTTQQFYGLIQAVGQHAAGAADGVSWTMTGGAGTSINTDGLLTVASGEAASTLTITATSNEDNTKSGTATVTLTDDAVSAAVMEVVVSSPSPRYTRGGQVQLSAVVSIQGSVSDVSVVWSITGNNDVSTNITNGTLSVGGNETGTLVVKATSNHDNTKYGEFTLVGQPAVVNVTISPRQATLEVEQTQQFSANVEVLGGATQQVTYSVSGKQSANTTINGQGLLSVGANETAAILKVAAISVGDRTKTDTAYVNVIVPSITSVTIIGDTSVEKGSTLQFRVRVERIGSIDTSVNWSVSGKNSSATTINASGLLSVGAAETAETLTVKAVSTADQAKYGELRIKVTGGTTAVASQTLSALLVHPNPVVYDVINVDEDFTGVVEIYTLGGTLVMVSNDASVNVSRLPAGIYVVKAGGKTAKVVKK